MNKESLLERIEILNENEKKTREQLNQVQMNLIAIDGARQDCNYWLQAIEEKEKEKKDKKTK